MPWKIEINGHDRDLKKLAYVRHDDAAEIVPLMVAQRQCLASKHRISELPTSIPRGERMAEAEANSIIENFLVRLPHDSTSIVITAIGGERIESLNIEVK